MNPMSGGAERDPELGRLLRDAMAGPNPGRFLARLSHALGSLPERRSQWDVLAGWSRPSVLVVAAAAGFLLGLAVWQGWRERMVTPAASVSAAMLEPTQRTDTPILYAVLEGR